MPKSEYFFDWFQGKDKTFWPILLKFKTFSKYQYTVPLSIHSPPPEKSNKQLFKEKDMRLIEQMRSSRKNREMSLFLPFTTLKQCTDIPQINYWTTEKKLSKRTNRKTDRRADKRIDLICILVASTKAEIQFEIKTWSTQLENVLQRWLQNNVNNQFWKKEARNNNLWNYITGWLFIYQGLDTLFQ